MRQKSSDIYSTTAVSIKGTEPPYCFGRHHQSMLIRNDVVYIQAKQVSESKPDTCFYFLCNRVKSPMVVAYHGGKYQ